MEHDPVEYPKVLIGGQQVEVRYTCGSIIRLKNEENITLEDIASQTLRGAEAIERTVKLLQAGINHTMKLTSAELADQIDLRDLPKFAAAINEALKKAAPQATPTPEAKPTLN